MHNYAFMFIINKILTLNLLLALHLKYQSSRSLFILCMIKLLIFRLDSQWILIYLGTCWKLHQLPGSDSLAAFTTAGILCLEQTKLR